MDNYDKDKYPHIVRKEGEPFFGTIGCCCECIYHKPVGGHPLCNGKSIMEVSLYICDCFGDSMPSLCCSHGIGCGMWERNNANE